MTATVAKAKAGSTRNWAQKKAVAKLKEKVKEYWDARQSKTSGELREQWQSYIRGWWNCFQLADRRREVNGLSGRIRRHMRKWLPSLRPPGCLRQAVFLRSALAAMAPPARAHQRAQTTGSQRPRSGHGLQRAWSEGNRPAPGHANSTENQNTQQLRVHHTVGLRGSRKMTAALFNPRMRKTARPVVREPWRAKSRQGRPILIHSSFDHPPAQAQDFPLTKINSRRLFPQILSRVAEGLAL